MPTVTPGYTFTGTTDPITYTKLNLLAQPTVAAIGPNDVTTTTIADLNVTTGKLANNAVTLPKIVAAAANNTFLARFTTVSPGSSDYEALDTTTTGLGFYTGAGGTVTQATSKATAFTLNTMCGQITTAADSLAAATPVSATWTNSKIATTDVVIISHKSSGPSTGGTLGAYSFNVSCVVNGTATLTIRNLQPSVFLAEALVLSFVVIKGVTS
jgi:hypothetical protein